MLHEPKKPGAVPMLLEVNTTCRYPVNDEYVVPALTELPLSRATCCTELHDGDVQRLTVTKSTPDSVENDVKDIWITALDAIIHWQFRLLT